MKILKEIEFINLRNAIFVFFIFLFLIVMLRTAWISDDAAITLRTVLNFVHGFGPVFNIDERVQAYTHPLWFIILSIGTLISGNVFYTTFFISIVLSTTAFGWLLYKSFSSYFVLMLIGFSAILSKAFIDFSTSGLENPLSHILLLSIVFVASDFVKGKNNRLITCFLFFSCLYLTRPDLILMVLPLGIYLLLPEFRYTKRLAFALLIAAIPVIAWTVFSVFYYGFPFPNTAYAKLGAGISIDERIIQGFKYLLHSLHKDPLTIFVIIVGVTIGLGGSGLSKSLSWGVIIYLIYILYIGGDFMEGRFLAAPFLVALILFHREISTRSFIIFSREISTRLFAIILMIPVIVLGLLSVYPNFIAGKSYSNRIINKSNGIADERGFYYQWYGLLNMDIGSLSPPPRLHWNISDRKVSVVCGGLGFNSIVNGPGVHYIDPCALADPLLARLPAKENPNWRIGHFVRQLPTNYIYSIKHGKNLLFDKKTACYWDAIRTVTRGALFNKDRFIEIARLNLGLVEPPNRKMYRTGNVLPSTFIPEVNERDIKTIREDGTPWNADGNIIFDDALDIILVRGTDIKSIDISVDNNDIYEVVGLSNKKPVLLATIQPKYTSGLTRHKIKLKAVASNIDTIRINAKSGNHFYSIGHLRVNAE